MEQIVYLVRVSCMTFNHAPYIVDAMNGFTMQQTSFPFVCTIVDDASTDGEPEVIREYLEEHFDLGDNTIVRNEETDDYLLTFARHKTNHNCYFAVLYLKYNHYSIKKSKMPYVLEWGNTKYRALCEGDDYWIDPLKLQKQVDFLESHPDFGLVSTAFRKFNQTKQLFYESERMEERVILFEDVLLYYGITTCTVMIKSSILHDYQREIRQKWLMGDLPLWLFASQKAKIFRMSDITAVYRVLHESASHSNNPEKNLSFLLSTINCKQFFIEKYGLVEEKLLIVHNNNINKLLKQGILTLYQPFVTEAIKYKKKYGIPISNKDQLYNFVLSHSWAKGMLYIFKQFVRHFKQMGSKLRKRIVYVK